MTAPSTTPYEDNPPFVIPGTCQRVNARLVTRFHPSASLLPFYLVAFHFISHTPSSDIACTKHRTPPFRPSRPLPLTSTNHNLATHPAQFEAIPTSPSLNTGVVVKSRFATNTVATLCAFSSRSFEIAFASSAILQICLCDSGRDQNRAVKRLSIVNSLTFISTALLAARVIFTYSPD